MEVIKGFLRKRKYKSAVRDKSYIISGKQKKFNLVEAIKSFLFILFIILVYLYNKI